MLKRTLPLWILLALAAAIPGLGHDFHSWRTDGIAVLGTSVGQQSSHQAFNLHDSATDAGATSYALFWENEHTNNGGITNPPFGDSPPDPGAPTFVPALDNRQQAPEVRWSTWPVVTGKTVPPARPTFTPDVPRAWNPVVVDGETGNRIADHILLSVTFEPEPPIGTSSLREQILNVYHPGTADGLPGNSTSVSATDRGTVRPFWRRGGNPQTPGLRIRDLEPVRASLNSANPGTGVVTQPPIFARVPAIYRNGAGQLVSEVLPVVYLVVGTGENGDPARVICLTLKKPATIRAATDPALDWLPTRGQLPTVGFGEPPDPDFFNANNGTGGAVMWSYQVPGRSGDTPVAGISFANIGSTTDSRPVLLVSTADGQVICLNAKAADVRALTEDGDGLMTSTVQEPRWTFQTPTLFPGTPQEETPGFLYGMAPAVARSPLTGAFSSVSGQPSFNTETNARAKGATDWLTYFADTYGTFRAFEAGGRQTFNAMGQLTGIVAHPRWTDEPPNNTFRRDALDNRERFLVPPVVYQGNTPLARDNGALVSGSTDVGYDDQVIFAAERGNLYALDCLGEFVVDGTSAAMDGTPTGTTHTRWRWPQNDTAFDTAGSVEPRVWPRELEDPFSDAFVTGGHTTDPYGGSLSASERRLGKRVDPGRTSYDGYYTRAPLAVTLGANTNPNGSVPNLDPGDDSLFVPYLAEQPDTTIKYGPSSAGSRQTLAERTISRPAGFRWFYEYIGSLKPYGFAQVSRPILEVTRVRANVGGTVFEVPLNRIRVGTVKENGLPSNRVRNILAPGPVGPNPNFDLVAPAAQDTVYLTATSWFEDATQQWRRVPLGASLIITYVPPVSATDSSRGAAVTETLPFPSCYRSVPDPAAPTDVTRSVVVRGRASLSAHRTRLEQRLLQRARAAVPPSPARPDTLYEEDPALVPTAEWDTYDWRPPAMYAAGSANSAGTLMAPAIFRGRIVALTNRLRLQRVILGCFHPTLLTSAPPQLTSDGISPPHYGPPTTVATARPFVDTYDPGEFYPDQQPPFGEDEDGTLPTDTPPFLHDFANVTRVGASVTLVDGWMYVTYRNGHLRGYANQGGGGVGTDGNPPYFELPVPGQTQGGNVVEAPIGDPTEATGARTGIYLLTRTDAGGNPLPTITVNDVLDQSVTPPAIRAGVRPLHNVASLDRSLLIEYGQTLFVAVDFGPETLLAGAAGEVDPHDGVREIDPRVLEAGNEVQGQIRSSNGAVQQLPGAARGVLPTRIDHDNNATTPARIMAIVPIFCGVPAPSNPLTPGTPLLREKNPNDANPFNTFQNELTYDLQVTQQGLQWRWPDNPNNGTSGGASDPNKLHYWETERPSGATRYPTTGGTSNGTPNWDWTGDRREWAPLLSYNNPFALYYDPAPASPAYEGMLLGSGPAASATLVDQYGDRNATGRRNGDPYEAFGGIPAQNVDGARSGSGRPVVPMVGMAIRGGGTPRAQQILFGEHGKATPVSSTLYPDLARLRVADRSYLSFAGRPLQVRVQGAPLTKMGKGADYGTRGDASLRNLPGAPEGSFEQNINLWDDAPDGFYGSIPANRVVVSRAGTNVDLSSTPVNIAGRIPPDSSGNFTGAGGLPTVAQMEALAVQVDIPRFTPDDIYSTRWRSADSARGSSPLTAFNPFFPGTLFGEVGRALWDRAERYARPPDPNAGPDFSERSALTARGEDVAPPAGYDPAQDDRTRRIVLFNDANNNGQLDLLPTFREAYRTFGVQVVVKPDLRLEAPQAAVDFGNLWHGKRQPGTDADDNPNTNPHLEIREWQQMQLMKSSGNATLEGFAAFYEQFWRPLTLLNSGNVNLAYVKPELAYATPAGGVQILAIPGEGIDPWRALPLLNALAPAGMGAPNPLADPLQILLRTSFDEQLLPDPSAPYGAATRGIWLQKAPAGAALPGTVAYVDPSLNPNGDPAQRDPGPGGPFPHPVQGVARPAQLTLNIPTGAALGQYGGTIRFYNDRSVTLVELPDDAGAPVGYRYVHPTGANLARNGVLDRRNDGEPLEPVTDPPVQVRARVVESVAFGRATISGTTLTPDPDGERRMLPAAIPDASVTTPAGTVRRLVLGFAGNQLGIGAGRPSLYDFYGARMELDTSRLLFPFDVLPMIRPPGPSLSEPWLDLSAAAGAGFSLLSAGGTGLTGRPHLSQDELFTRSLLAAWTEQRTVSQGVDEFRLLYRQLAPSGGPLLELLPGGQPPDLAVPRSTLRFVPITLENAAGIPVSNTWLALYGRGPAQRRNLAFTYFWDPATGQPAARSGVGELPGPTEWAPENNLSVGRGLTSVNAPSAVQSYFLPRAPAPLPAQPGEPAFVQQENTELPAMTWVAYAGTSQRLARSDIYLSRLRTSSLLTARSRGGAGNALASQEDYARVRFPRFQSALVTGAGTVPIGGDTLLPNPNRTVYAGTGADWLVHPYSPVQLYLVRPDLAPNAPGGAANPLPLLNPTEVPQESPTGELHYPLSTPLRSLAGLGDFRVVVDRAAGTVRLSRDLRTLARLATGVALGQAAPDPLLRAEYTAATLRLTSGGASAGDPVLVSNLTVQRPRGVATPTVDASWYRQQIDGTKWANGLPVAAIADRMWVFWRRGAGANNASPSVYYRVLRPGIRVSYGALYGIRPGELSATINGAPVTPEEVNPATGQLFFPYAMEGQQVAVSYLGPTGAVIQELHTIHWEDETGERQLPMQTSVNEGSLDAFASYEEVPMTTLGGTGTVPVRKLERVWLFWSSTRGSGGDILYATLAPRLGPEVNVNGSVTLFRGLGAFSPAGAAQAQAAAAEQERRRPFVLPPVGRRGPLAAVPPARGSLR